MTAILILLIRSQFWYIYLWLYHTDFTKKENSPARGGAVEGRRNDGNQMSNRRTSFRLTRLFQSGAIKSIIGQQRMINAVHDWG